MFLDFQDRRKFPKHRSNNLEYTLEHHILPKNWVIRVWQGMYTVLNRQNIGPCLSNPNAVSACARSQAINHVLRDAPLIFANMSNLNLQTVRGSCAVRAQSQAIMDWVYCEMHFSACPNILATDH